MNIFTAIDSDAMNSELLHHWLNLALERGSIKGLGYNAGMCPVPHTVLLTVMDCCGWKCLCT